jgi:hypothetical protein
VVRTPNDVPYDTITAALLVRLINDLFKNAVGGLNEPG